MADHNHYPPSPPQNRHSNPLFPYPEKLKRESVSNFALWYQKRIPVEVKNYKAADSQGKHDGAVEYYARTYDEIKNKNKEEIKNVLRRKHHDQIGFAETMERAGYEYIALTGTLISPLVTGIGETHPSETSLTFDRNLGIPYIPAPTLKGNSRLAHILDWVAGHKEEIKNQKTIDDEKNVDKLPEIFGTQDERGKVIFLDAYPEKIPSLHVDIMNPHYGEYYQGERAPSDDQAPIPVKFLTVGMGSTFVFRVVVSGDLVEPVKKALKKAMEEGIGAKNAIGYGRFQVEEGEPATIKKAREEQERKKAEEKEERKDREKLNNMSETEQFLYRIQKLSNDTEDISHIVREALASEHPKEIYQALKEKLEELEQWKPSGSKQKKNKIKERNQKIEERC